MLVATTAHCADAFEVLHCVLHGSPPQPLTGTYHLEAPFFVTLKKRGAGGGWQLRGCIGTLQPRPLSQLHDYTRKSAFEDGRFDPVERHELADLQVGVSLLVDYEEAAHVTDWVVGTHGITISFRADGRAFSATYLPEVAVEQGWGQHDAVESLVRKAGYRGSLPQAARAAMRVTRYKSSKATLSYDEWVVLRGNPPSR